MIQAGAKYREISAAERCKYDTVVEVARGIKRLRRCECCGGGGPLTRYAHYGFAPQLLCRDCLCGPYEMQHYPGLGDSSLALAQDW